MAELANLVARLQVNVASKGVDSSTRGLDRLGKEALQAESRVKKLGVSAKVAFASVAGFATGALVTSLFRTNIEFEKLRASLTTVTGSADKSADAFERIKKFASETPFSIQEVTQSFIKLKALGLNPSEKALASYGNTASAMGFSLNQMIEAVADAATGEFERLKEFGIKAKSEGDKVTFTFQGVATTVGKNATEIEEYLLNIGENKFGDATALQAKTMGGAISNLSDSWANFLDTVLNDESSGAISALLAKMSDGINNLSDRIKGDSPFEKLQKESEEARLSFVALLKEYNTPRLLRLNPFASTEGLGEKVKTARLKFEALEKQLWKTGKSFDDLAKKEDTAAEKAYVMGDAMKKALADATKEAAKTNDTFNSLFNDITAPDAKENKDVNILDVAHATTQAKTANRDGNYDEAIVKAKQGFDLLNQMKEAGTLTDGVLEYMAENLRKIGQEAGNADLANLQVQVDKEKAQGSMTEAQRAMQAQADAAPIIQQVIAQIAAGSVDFPANPTNATSGATVGSPAINPDLMPDASVTAPKPVPQMKPTIVQFPNGKQHMVYEDAKAGGSMAKEIAREAAKRGKR